MISDTTSKSSKRSEKIERIITVASELFADRDYHQVCMDDIAERANVGKGTLYNLFESKQDLYFSIIRFRLTKLIKILEKAYDSRAETLKNLRSLILHLHKFMSKHPHFYRIWKKEENRVDQDFRSGIGMLQKQLYELVLKILAQGERQGVIRRSMEPELITHILLGMIDGLRKSPETVYRRERGIDVLVEVLMSGIGTGRRELKVLYKERTHAVKGL
jgi:TetR/AcrR family fatty acid metabolism transcriptional regulator